jgi:hypothetical protein
MTRTYTDTNGEHILVNTAMGRLKYDNVLRDPRVAISLADQTNPYNMATVRGIVVEHTTNGAEEYIDKLAKKYFGLEKYPGRVPGAKRVILKIKPERVYHQKPR